MPSGEAGHRLWTILAPPAALAVAGIGIILNGGIPLPVLILAVPVLFAAVFSAVHHAEVIAHRLGQPLGSILLAMAVMVIEV